MKNLLRHNISLVTPMIKHPGAQPRAVCVQHSLQKGRPATCFQLGLTFMINWRDVHVTPGFLPLRQLESPHRNRD